MTSSNSFVSPISKRLEGKVAIVTGGASGLGECTAMHFAKHGAKVIIADIQDDLGQIICKNSNTNGEIISSIHCDVTKESDVEKAVNFAVSKYGKLDIMFSNAGITGNPNTSILGVGYENLKRVFDVNVFGAFLCAKHASRVMIPAKKGSIVITSSVTSVVSLANVPHEYVASKHALVGLTKNLCVELGQHGIRVNCVSPYGFASPLLTKWYGMEKKMLEGLTSAIGNLNGHVFVADDIADGVVFLASDESKYISGLNLVIDGGYSTTNAGFKEYTKKMSA